MVPESLETHGRLIEKNLVEFNPIRTAYYDVERRKYDIERGKHPPVLEWFEIDPDSDNLDFEKMTNISTLTFQNLIETSSVLLHMIFPEEKIKLRLTRKSPFVILIQVTSRHQNILTILFSLILMTDLEILNLSLFTVTTLIFITR